MQLRAHPRGLQLAMPACKEAYSFAGSIRLVFASGVGLCLGQPQLRGERRFERPRRGTEDQGRAARARNGGTGGRLRRPGQGEARGVRPRTTLSSLAERLNDGRLRISLSRLATTSPSGSRCTKWVGDGSEGRIKYCTHERLPRQDRYARRYIGRMNTSIDDLRNHIRGGMKANHQAQSKCANPPN
jgi:hypothetical protein